MKIEVYPDPKRGRSGSRQINCQSGPDAVDAREQVVMRVSEKKHPGSYLAILAKMQLERDPVPSLPSG
jgi:hypothetical protein